MRIIRFLMSVVIILTISFLFSGCLEPPQFILKGDIVFTDSTTLVNDRTLMVTVVPGKTGVAVGGGTFDINVGTSPTLAKVTISEQNGLAYPDALVFVNKPEFKTKFMIPVDSPAIIIDGKFKKSRMDSTDTQIIILVK